MTMKVKIKRGKKPKRENEKCVRGKLSAGFNVNYHPPPLPSLMYGSGIAKYWENREINVQEPFE